jgi:photosynthetic reaction center cytochrome c subunit
MNGFGRNFVLGVSASVAALVILAIVLTTFERPPVESVQRGFRGTGMELLYNPRTVAANLAAVQLPEVLDPADNDGPRASEIYENVKVLGGLSNAQFLRVMQAMTNWVAPDDSVPNGGCNYCHNPENLAADDHYTKIVSRRMLQMVHRINSTWQSHVGETGVTCYTCHRGQPVPAAVWSTTPAQGRTTGLLESSTGQNLAAPSVGLTSLPYDVFTPFLLQDHEIRVLTRPDAAAAQRSSIKQTEWTYGLMVHFAESLGVNCTYCHNSRAFWDWEESSPPRATAWYGIRMLRDVNGNYIEPLRTVMPPERHGPLGDALKANCSTCHRGAYKPLYGAPMLRDYPELREVRENAAQ